MKKFGSFSEPGSVSSISRPPDPNAVIFNPLATAVAVIGSRSWSNVAASRRVRSAVGLSDFGPPAFCSTRAAIAAACGAAALVPPKLRKLSGSRGSSLEPKKVEFARSVLATCGAVRICGFA